MVENSGWIAFNIKENFLDERDTSGFSSLVSSMIDEGHFEPRLETRYVHRKSVTGDELHYIAFVGRKRKQLPTAN